jgi:DNA primase
VLQEIKEELLKSPEAIEELLIFFGFEHIKTSRRDIRFARDANGGRNISIRLDNNEALYVNDFARGISADIFQYIIQEKNATFREVLQQVKKILGLSSDWTPRPKHKELFGGIYKNIYRNNKEIILPTYDDNVLNAYECVGNVRFLHDGISLEAQQFWDVRFSVADDSIVIPIRNEFGDLVGTKMRINRDPEEGESKYWYALPVQMSQVLYGYSENYQYLYGADTVYIGESEKFCQQLYTMNVRNCVSLGSHSLSEKQCKLLLQLQAKSFTFMFDDGLDLAETKRNADMIKNMASMMDVEIYFFDYRDCLELGEKDSPSDHGIETWNYIIENHIENINELEETNEL